VAPIRFVLCIHNHQPVGNFDHVIEDAYQQSYLPFLEVMERHTRIPWVLHNSGCLWEWLEHAHPEYIERIAQGVAEGRIELLGGGFYEPVLPALTPEDRRGQIERMRDYLKGRFGSDVRGIWLTERVWEPDLPVDLVDAGVSYLPIDDTQLHQVGVAPEAVRGGFLTESGGRSLRLFPALMSLRYRIPYADPIEAAGFLRDPFPGGGEGLAVYADDGEKFGVWPGTHDLVYKKRWLDRFLTALEEAGDAIRPTTFRREIKEHPPQGLVYLPTGSYAEMGEWSLPAAYQDRMEKVQETLKGSGQEEDAKLFVRGGFWRNFFARYPESSWMHMRSLEASGRCRAFRSAMPTEAWEQCRDHLWRAQCNCAYWHGVFGGLYLPHLRHGIYQELIRGETLLARGLHGRQPWVAVREADLDIDGHNEIVLENDQLALYLDPNHGGRLVEWDDRGAEYNLINILGRRPEHYHRDVQEGAASDDTEASTIHGGVRTKEDGLRELLTYDWYDRAALTDHFYDAEPDPQKLLGEGLHEIGDFVDQPYQVAIDEQPTETSIRMWRTGALWRNGQAQALSVEKIVTLRPGERGFEVRYRYRNVSEQDLRIWAAHENHGNLLAADAPDRFLVVNGRKARPARLGAVSKARAVESRQLVEGWQSWVLGFTPESAVDFCRYPVRTVSLSESGAESNDQGLALLFYFPLELKMGEEHRFTYRAFMRDGQAELRPAKRPAGRESKAKR